MEVGRLEVVCVVSLLDVGESLEVAAEVKLEPEVVIMELCPELMDASEEVTVSDSMLEALLVANVVSEG